MSRFSREYIVDTDDDIDDIQDDKSNMVDIVDTYQRSASVSASVSKGNIMVAFARKPNDEKKQETELNESGYDND
ncbi:hypothetical protein OCU04_010466, partial [Sclerotinia nivalis]